ncbi:PaaI family thioesterase [Nocardioides sp. WS12]|uniref:PaaI family thioesterase n=1 Tax=Nocardioides sp. WS12 TaxID=2486272 RepID=UPI0015FB50F7|nr:PaaI family thioesterase [Nocardioides sp. WS12]
MTETFTDAQQEEIRVWFRDHFDRNVPFSRLCNINVVRWERDEVVLRSQYADDLSAHPGVFHGGVIATLIDTAGTCAILAGQDYNNGSRLSTISLNVNYLSVGQSEDVAATARCLKRGRTMHVADIQVHGVNSGRLLAVGQMTASVSGTRSGLLGPLPPA